MEILTQNFRRDPNALVQSAYMGVAHGNKTVTRITALDKQHDRMAVNRVYGAGIPRGCGGQIATLVLGGMETTLDEIEYILQGVREKKFAPLRKPADIAQMCKMVAERRNDKIKYLRKNPSEAPRRRRKGLYLPRGFRMVPTTEPGLKITVRA